MTRDMHLGEAFAEAIAHQQAGRLFEAEHMLQRILAVAPQHPQTLYFLGLVESEQNRFSEAAQHIEQAIAAAPDNKLFTHHIYEIYRRLGRHEEAQAAAERAIAANPKDAMIRANLAAIHHDRLDLDAAISWAERALALQPELAEAHFALAQSLLLRGDLERGFAEYEWRWGLPSAGRLLTPTDLPQWNGKRMRRGRLLLVGDQGFGDVIMFARYLPMVARRCSDIAMVCAPELHPIIRQILPSIALFGRWDAPAADAYCPLSSLPFHFGTTLATIPASDAYIAATPARLEAPPGHLRIGITWAGAQEHHNDRNRSMPLAALAPLAAIPGVTLVSLQKGGARSELFRFPGPVKPFDGGRRLRDFQQTAELIAALDLVVSVDTSVAHLAAALGKPVWILLAKVPDWRWLLDRSDTPWYRSARLFRQARTGDWTEIVDRVVQAIPTLKS